MKWGKERNSKLLKGKKEKHFPISEKDMIETKTKGYD